MSPSKPPLPPYILISKRFKTYDKTIRDIWEAYHFHSFYLPVLHDLIKKENVPALELPALGGPKVHVQKRNNTLGAISHILAKVSPQRSLIVAVSQSEAFLQYLAVRVFRDFPGRLLGGGDTDQRAREMKLLEVMVKSASRAEMLDKVIEERVRGIFYGAPSDFFLKDKAKLGFGDHFSTNCPDAVNKFVELCARRNVLIHNDGKVDRKYLREAPGSTFKLHETISVDEPYLREALLTLRGLCAAAGVLVCERVYSDAVPSGRMLQRYKTFEP
jgi:hypothetical protein